jgi:hypothetical protein
VSPPDAQDPFADVQGAGDGAFSIPELKWRELLFVGALRLEGDAYVRDPVRPLPPFCIPDLFPTGVRFRASREGPRVVLRREAGRDGVPGQG